MTKKYDSFWLSFDGFGDLNYHHQIIDPLLGAYVGIHIPFELLEVGELLQNGGRSANTIAELLWHE